MVSNITSHVHTCRSCAKAKDYAHKKNHETKLFPPTGPIDDIVIDLLGPLKKTRNDNNKIIVITDWYIKLTPTAPTSETTSPYIATVMMNH